MANPDTNRTYDVQQYNNYKGGLDVADSHTTRYLTAHRQYRWTKKALIYHIKQLVVNAWVIYKKVNNVATSQHTFMKDLIRGIAKKYTRPVRMRWVQA